MDGKRRSELGLKEMQEIIIKHAYNDEGTDRSETINRSQWRIEGTGRPGGGGVANKNSPSPSFIFNDNKMSSIDHVYSPNQRNDVYNTTFNVINITIL